jgi:hypothetical protein
MPSGVSTALRDCDGDRFWAEIKRNELIDLARCLAEDRPGRLN